MSPAKCASYSVWGSLVENDVRQSPSTRDPARPLVKICGLTDVATARAALELGADYLGFVLAPSKRQVTSAELAALTAALPADAPTVGVFVDTPADAINQIAAECGLAIVQLSGDEPPDEVARIHRPVFRSIRVGPDDALERVCRELDLYGDRVTLFVLDASQPGARGGTGVTCDWRLAAGIARRFPCLLAGGLTPENAAEALAAVGPRGLDVSTGVEHPAVPGERPSKDLDRVRRFIAAAHSVAPACSGAPGSAISLTSNLIRPQCAPFRPV